MELRQKALDAAQKQWADFLFVSTFFEHFIMNLYFQWFLKKLTKMIKVKTVFKQVVFILQVVDCDVFLINPKVLKNLIEEKK